MRSAPLGFSHSTCSPLPPSPPAMRIPSLHPKKLPPSPRPAGIQVFRRAGSIGSMGIPFGSGSPSNHMLKTIFHHGICRASQVVDLFPSVSPEIVVRDARLEDCWDVAETHCSSFFPDYTFPIDLVLRIDRFVALLSGFSVPPGCMRTCLVAITGTCINDNLFLGSEGFKLGGFEGKFSINRGSVAGILTVDTVADFLPRKGPLRQRRSGIAYISNVAVRETQRRKGIAKRLVIKSEARARSWGCRAVALHCDAANVAAMKLYMGLGFKCIKVPEHGKWPHPKASPGTKFNFMMKLLAPSGTT